MTSQNSEKSLGKFYLVILIFIVPIVGSWLLFYFRDNFHFKTVNRGILVTPSIHADYLYAPTPDSKKKLWHIVHVDNGSCDAECEHINYQLRQVQKVFGKDQNRLEVVSVHGKDAVITRLEKTFPKETYPNIVVTNKIYLIDPLGHLFMMYPDTEKPMNILKDLKRVLEVSQIG